MAVTAGASFTFVPTWVYPIEPEFYNIITPSESQKKEYFNLSSTSVDKYRLRFSGVTDTTYNGGSGILDHFNGQYGGYQSFPWTSVPSYINSGASITGRWIDGTFKATPLSNGWDIEIEFEKDN